MNATPLPTAQAIALILIAFMAVLFMVTIVWLGFELTKNRRAKNAARKDAEVAARERDIEYARKRAIAHGISLKLKL